MSAEHSLSVDLFSHHLSRDFQRLLEARSDVAVAVSGGPDSLALCWLLNGWAREAGVKVHALHVDHGLREESAQQAETLDSILGGMEALRYTALRWQGDKPQARIQEEARKARYALMAEYCREHGIGVLFLAHHMDDQAETVLFRLAKGSGLDGLSGMQPIHAYNEGLSLCRPLLGVDKEDLVSLCEREGLSYFCDPSNEKEDFARVRLRKSRAVLEEEGLSNKRLAVSAQRLARARDALDEWAEKTWEEVIIKFDTKHIEFNLKPLLDKPEEVVLRVVLKAFGRIGADRDYAPRMEKVEALLYDLRSPQPFRKRTLGGVIFERDDTAQILRLDAE